MRIVSFCGMTSASSALRPVEMARNLAKMDNSELFFELKSIEDILSRREVTAHVYDLKMRKYSSKLAWRGSMAHHLVEEVHPMFRNAFDRVLRSSSEGNVKVDQFNKTNKSLHHHHEGEDAWFFPQLKAKHPQISTQLAVLENDHANLVKMEREIKAGSYPALVEFVAALNDHLNREEMLIVPFLLSEDSC